MNPIFSDPDRSNDELIISYGSYKPWSWHTNEGGNSSNYPEFSGRILDLKEGQAQAVQYFWERVAPDLGSGFAIAVVPSHDPKSAGSGLPLLAAKLAQTNNRLDASNCLVRTQKIDK